MCFWTAKRENIPTLKKLNFSGDYTFHASSMNCFAYERSVKLTNQPHNLLKVLLGFQSSMASLIFAFATKLTCLFFQLCKRTQIQFFDFHPMKGLKINGHFSKLSERIEMYSIKSLISLMINKHIIIVTRGLSDRPPRSKRNAL